MNFIAEKNENTFGLKKLVGLFFFRVKDLSKFVCRRRARITFLNKISAVNQVEPKLNRVAVRQAT